MIESRLGEQQEFRLTEALDQWVPMAGGHSARVFLGFLKEGQRSRQRAVKVMRPTMTIKAPPVFLEEVKILNVMNNVPGVTKMVEMGFLKIENMNEFPDDTNGANAHSLQGIAHRYGLNELSIFISGLYERVAEGCLPYIALEKRQFPSRREKNLLTLYDLGYSKGKPLSVNQAIHMAAQICDILDVAHNRNIWYRDHKILHYSWHIQHERIYVFDLNVSKLEPRGLSEDHRRFDIVHFAARVLFHMFTGDTHPDALMLGATRPDEIENAPDQYAVEWNFDARERLSAEIRTVLEDALKGKYHQASALKKALLACVQSKDLNNNF